MDIKLVPPCTYQGGKQRLANQIVDIFYSENNINDDTKFYDLCCGSGAVSLEMINRGFNPNNITMIDIGCWGGFWNAIANDEFDLDVFKKEIDKIPDISNIKKYLKDLSKKDIDDELEVYHYLILQSGAFGSIQIYQAEGKWKNNSFRDYWLPTETSNRRSPVNPMMPMPDTLYERTKNIVNSIGGCITASRESVFDALLRIDEERNNSNMIIYIDPPYMNTTGYESSFSIYDLIDSLWNVCPVYVSEGLSMNNSKSSILLSKGRNKGNMNGTLKKKPCEEWLNKF